MGMSAFQGCGAGIQLTSLPVGLTKVLAHTFSGCPNVKISSFGSNDSTGSQLNEIQN